MLRSSRLEASLEAATLEMWEMMQDAQKLDRQVEDLVEAKTGCGFGVDVNTKCSTRGFNLNCPKVLKKKLEATNRPNLYEVSNNLDSSYIACQAGLYNLIRIALHIYYTQHKTGYNVLIVISKDKQQQVVQMVYKVRKCAGMLPYTISMYHTKSALYINGKGVKTFIDKDWLNITELQDC